MESFEPHDFRLFVVSNQKKRKKRTHTTIYVDRFCCFFSIRCADAAALRIMKNAEAREEDKYFYVGRLRRRCIKVKQTAFKSDFLFKHTFGVFQSNYNNNNNRKYFSFLLLI